MRAPSTSASNFAQTTVGCTSGWKRAGEQKPQSAPAMTFSRRTTSAYLTIRSATRRGCSTTLVVWVMTPGMMTLPSGSLTSLKGRHSCSCRGFAARHCGAPAVGDGERRVVDLQEEAGVRDRLVLLVHGLGDGEDVLLEGAVVAVAGAMHEEYKAITD